MKKILSWSLGLVLSASVMMSNMVVNDQSIRVEAAYEGLAKFEELKIDDNKSWATLNSYIGGIGTYKSLNGKGTYRLFTDVSGYTYNAGDYISIRYDGIDLADEEFMFSGDNGNIYLEKTVSYHEGYITMELPDDANRVFKSVNPKLFRIRGTCRDIKVGDEFTISGIEIHKAGTLPSWDNGLIKEYDPYVKPRGISVTYYDDIYSRGFTWSTNDKIKSSELLLVELPKGKTEDDINWDIVKGINASVTSRTDVNGNKWNIFKVHVSNLKPGATYLYMVVNEDGSYSETGTLVIEKEKNDVDGLTFLHLTDSQESAKVSYEVWSDVLREGKRKYPESSFVAFSGDFTNFSYDSVNMNEWIWGLDTASNTLMNMPIAPSSGNHDIYDYAFTDRFDINWADYVKDSDADILSGGNYFYTYGKDVLFINLNTNINVYYPESEDQLDWLRETLEQYKDYKWKVVQLHKGPMSTGDHSKNGDVEDYRDELCPIFSKYKVDLVLQGHDHVYTRTASYPYWTENNDNIKNYKYEAYEEAGVVTENYLFDGETRLWNLEPAGTHYVTINYCANKKYDPIEDHDERIHIGKNPVSTENGCSSQPNKPMYGVVRIKGDILCYDAYTYDYDTKESKLYDTFSVDKGEKKQESSENTSEITSEENTENSSEENQQVTTGESNQSNTTDTTQTNSSSTNKPAPNSPAGKTERDSQSNTNQPQNNTSVDLRKNAVITDKKTCGKYKITKLVKKNGKITGGNVTYMKPLNKNCKKASIPNCVVLSEVKFKVTSVNNNAFINCRKLKTVTIGTNVTKIGTKAFYKCKALKTVKIKSTKIKFIGKNAFGKTNSDISFTLAKKGRARTIRLIKKAK